MRLAVPLEEEADQLSAALPPLMIEAERVAAAVSLGVHGRRKSGIGETFWQFRHYRAEDSSSAIDWRQSAKSTHLYVREREWEAAQGVWFCRDGSAGMRFRSGDTSKLDRANLIAAALAALLIRGGERVALFGSGRAPSSSRLALRRFAQALADTRPTTAALPPEAQIAKFGQLVWLSDFLSPLPDIEKRFAWFTGFAVHAYIVHIIDPAEEDFPYKGRTRFEAPDGTLGETLGRAESVGGAYRVRFRAHAESVAIAARKFGWTYVSHRTDSPPTAALVGLFSEMSGATRR